MMRALFMLLVLACAAPAALAQDRPCGKAEAANAEKSIDRVTSWPQLQKAFKDFRHCDSVAAVADLYSETVVRLIVDWKNVDAFVAEMQSAPFKAFVIEHLKRPVAKDDLDSVYSRVKASCPAKHEAFCAELAEIVKAANK
ncbi:MAG TPA: hypothetical protein VM122_07150 [Usitatibacter sp.]|nr:hypothetical protein [Usitatibacter sp.]